MLDSSSLILAFNAFTLGVTSFSVDLLLDRVVVVPRIVRSFSVDSRWPVFGEVPVAVSPADIDGNSDGETKFVRSYVNGSVLRLTASAEFRGFFAPGIAVNYLFQKSLKNDVFFSTAASLGISSTII